MQAFAQTSQAASAVISQKAAGYNVLGNPRPAVTAYVASRTINEGTFPVAGGCWCKDISEQITKYGSLAKVPNERRRQHPQRHVSRIGSHPLPDEG